MTGKPGRRTLGLVAIAAGAAAAAVVAGQTGPPRVAWANVLTQEDGWYQSPQARTIADTVLLYQRPDGGWPKDIDMTMAPAAAPPGRLAAASTIDNGATTTQARLLARVFGHARDPEYAAAVRRAVAYLLDAQYPNGGWPQVFPLEKGYSRHITFNDNAMISVMELLDDVARGAPAYGFLDDASRARAAAAVDRGITLVLRAQLTVNGRLTAWCAQHDEVTLEPRGARTYEHPSLSGNESVGIVRFLMRRPAIDARIRTAVDAAVAWLASARLSGWRLEQRLAPGTPRGWDRVLVADASAPPLWARFYEIGTNRPIYSGRDGVIKYTLAEIEYERRTGYAWIGDWPRALVEREYPAWLGAQGKRVHSQPPTSNSQGER